MKILLLTLALATGMASYAQIWDIDNYSWETERVLYELDTAQFEEPAIKILQKSIIETNYLDDEKTQLETRMMYHRIYRVNQAAEISNYNRVYIPVGSGEEVLKLKARTISPSGLITEMDLSDIREIVDEDEVNYKIFAIEGVEEGGEIEYIYVVRRNFFRFGSIFLQYSIPMLEAYFTFITPSNLVFEAKSYNGLPEPVDTVINDRNYLTVVADNIPALLSEPFTFRSAFRKRVEFRFSYNTVRGRQKLFTYNEAAQNIFSNIYDFNSSEKRLLNRALRNANFSRNDTEHQKLIKIDTYIRNNYYINARLEDSDIRSTLDMKMTTRNGYLRLHSGLFEAAGIESEIVYTTDRSEKLFDPDFETWNYLSDVMFYFPSTDKYLAPFDAITRYGFIPYEYENNHGLFVRKIKIGDMETGIGEVRYIRPAPSSENAHNLYIDVAFTEDMMANKLSLKSEISGQTAILRFSFYPFMDKEEQEELIEDVLTYYIKNADEKNLELKTPLEYPLTYDPVIIEADAVTSEFIETAGDRILFRLGDLIGRQSELFADKERTMPVENTFNRSYLREINLKMPDNYSITNLDDIIFDVVTVENGTEIFYFKSSYTIEDNVLKVRISEAYEQMSYPVEKFEDFRKVINAAADFNKVVLVMEPV